MNVDKNSQQFQEFERHLIRTLYLHLLCKTDFINAALDFGNLSRALSILSDLQTFIFESELAYQTEYAKVDSFLTEIRGFSHSFYYSLIEHGLSVSGERYAIFRKQIIDLFNSSFPVEAA
ncbi:hypothetical protein [Methylomicrobium sp. Wu6]|uniref:hypothetical protein n=1 Tax=Methylomicrobium sp. Wu6 TaxID=3107928 RepID=UPI002DD672C8|nr:hypothetical protein [Methylomicrobium sp. Wu6]MEC4749812.1 hypothetical protein [Methylomicrobium sp. Wu6]